MSLNIELLNFYKVVRAFSENKDLVEATLRRDTVEMFNGRNRKILGLSFGLFMAILVLYIVSYIWAIYLISSYSKKMTKTSVVFGVIFLMLGMPYVSVIILYAGMYR